MKIKNEHLEIMWLCFACPEVMPLSNCVLQKYRERIALGKTDTVEKLSVDDANTLIKTHEKCLQVRINEKYRESVSILVDN